ncbi:MAG: helix-turn-helix transcriptional regulator [Caldilineaceae bacterium]|nr:helix-turn-helix transcriptional regulator [Caldilineaceae bacterium]
MPGKIKKRIYRTATPEEKAQHSQVRQQIDAELPELRQRAREKLAAIVHLGVELPHIIDLLKAERIKQGLTLAQLKEATGIEGANLVRLENHEDANPTINTLTRYADAVGKKVLVVLADAED